MVLRWNRSATCLWSPQRSDSTLNVRAEPDSHHEFLHTCAKQKDAEAYNRSQMATEFHYSDQYWYPKIVEILKRTDPGERLVPGWISWKVNRFIRVSAAELGWGSDLIWTDHGIRHGSAVDAARDAAVAGGDAEAQDLAVFRRTGQLSEEMSFYAESPKHRQARALEVKLLKVSAQEIAEAHEKLQEVRDAVREAYGLKSSEDLDDLFEFTEEQEHDLDDKSAGAFLVALRHELLPRFKARKKSLKKAKNVKAKKSSSVPSAGKRSNNKTAKRQAKPKRSVKQVKRAPKVPPKKASTTAAVKRAKKNTKTAMSGGKKKNKNKHFCFIPLLEYQTKKFNKNIKDI